MHHMFKLCLFVTFLCSANTALAQANPNTNDKPNYTFDARIRPRVEIRSGRFFGVNETDLAKKAPGFGDFTTIQSRLGARASYKNLKARLILQHVGILGATGGDALTNTGVDLPIGWFSFEPNDILKLQFGRFALNYGDQRVLGAVGWDQNGRAWDGLRAVVKPTKDIKLDIFVTKFADGLADQTSNNLNRVFDQDGFLIGSYNTFSSLAKPVFDEIDVYLLADILVDDLTDDDANTRHRFTFGSRLKGTWSIIDATVEGAYQFGSLCQLDAQQQCTDQTRGISAWFVDSSINIMLFQPNKIRLILGGSIASGDDTNTEKQEAYNHLYPTAHKFLGLTDVIGPRSNVMEERVGVAGAVQNLSLNVTTHLFQRVEPDTENYGLEVDTTLGWQIQKGISFHAGHGIFIPSKAAALRDINFSKNHNWMFIQLIGSI